MGRLIYLTLTSLDGFIGDGDYSWSAPNEEVMAALTAGLAEVGTYLYGRRTYETMAVWETDPAAAGQSPESAAFATTWQAADKVVFSSTLAQVHTRRTRLERQLAVTAVRSVGQYPQARRVRAGFGRRVVDTSEHARTAERRPRVIAASIGPDSVRLLSPGPAVCGVCRRRCSLLRHTLFPGRCALAARSVLRPRRVPTSRHTARPRIRAREGRARGRAGPGNHGDPSTDRARLLS
jgi:dihydrofolate reductase